MFTLKEIKTILNAQLISGNENTIIERFNISNKNHYKDDFYIPIIWREDRQKYIIEAVNAGAIGYMISTQNEKKEEIIAESIKINSNILILQVEDINEAIYKMALYKRKQNINIPIIAVTGSVGKTSTCEMISSIIKQERKVLSDNGNNNTRPLLSWLMLDIEDYEMAVLEVGIARKNVMEPISKLLEPSIVVINNIGTSHMGNFGSKDVILEEKIKLINCMKDEKVVFLNYDDPMLRELKLDESYNIVKYSIEEAKNIIQNEDFVNFEMNVYGENTELKLNSYGNHNVCNAICAIKIAELLNIDKENIKRGLANYISVEKRFKIIRKKNYTIIDDTYNASLESMKAGLMSANMIKNCGRKIAVLGEMLELGEYSKELHMQVGEVFKKVNFDILLTQGDNTRYICEIAKKYMLENNIINFENKDNLLDYLFTEIKERDLIYLKASRKMGFDNIVRKLLDVI